MYKDGAELREVDNGQVELRRAGEWEREGGVRLRLATTNGGNDGNTPFGLRFTTKGHARYYQDDGKISADVPANMNIGPCQWLSSALDCMSKHSTRSSTSIMAVCVEVSGASLGRERVHEGYAELRSPHEDMVIRRGAEKGEREGTVKIGDDIATRTRHYCTPLPQPLESAWPKTLESFLRVAEKEVSTAAFTFDAGFFSDDADDTREDVFVPAQCVLSMTAKEISAIRDGHKKNSPTGEFGDSHVEQLLRTPNINSLDLFGQQTPVLNLSFEAAMDRPLPTVFVVHIWGYFYKRQYTRGSVASETEEMNIYDHGWTTAYWLMGVTSNDPSRLAFFAGFYKSIQPPGAAGVRRVDAVEILLTDGDPIAVLRWSINLALHLDESGKDKQIIRGRFRVLAITETIPDLIEGENDENHLSSTTPCEEATTHGCVHLPWGPKQQMKMVEHTLERLDGEWMAESEVMYEYVDEPMDVMEKGIRRQENRCGVSQQEAGEIDEHLLLSALLDWVLRHLLLTTLPPSLIELYIFLYAYFHAPALGFLRFRM
ncbi:hypothetical protein EDD85DRAFT_798368 [Armillaria nabsnona]|nr:hypothetical protein EDD85DRAFT_798368 [Armillaria nabsnona]